MNAGHVAKLATAVSLLALGSAGSVQGQPSKVPKRALAASITAPEGGWAPDLIGCHWISEQGIGVFDGRTLGWRGGSVLGVDALTPAKVAASGSRDLGAAMTNQLATDSLHSCTVNQQLRLAVAASGAPVQTPVRMRWRDSARYKSIEREGRRIDLQEAVAEKESELERSRLFLEVNASLEEADGGLFMRPHSPRLQFVAAPARPALCTGTPLGRPKAFGAVEERMGAFCLAIRNWLVEDASEPRIFIPATAEESKRLVALPPGQRRIWLRITSVQPPEVYGGESGAAGTAASTVLREVGEVHELLVTSDDRDGARVLFVLRFRTGKDFQAGGPPSRSSRLDARMADISSSAADVLPRVRLPAATRQGRESGLLQVQLRSGDAGLRVAER